MARRVCGDLGSNATRPALGVRFADRLDASCDGGGCDAGGAGSGVLNLLTPSPSTSLVWREVASS